MSRFEEIVNEAVDEVVIGEALKAETLAAHIAERVRERQHGLRAEVTIKARYPEHKKTPVTGLTTQELVAAAARERLVEQGFTDDEIERVFDSVPVTTHNQRGIGSLYVGCVEGCDAELRAESLL